MSLKDVMPEIIIANRHICNVAMIGISYTVDRHVAKAFLLCGKGLNFYKIALRRLESVSKNRAER